MARGHEGAAEASPQRARAAHAAAKVSEAEHAHEATADAPGGIFERAALSLAGHALPPRKAGAKTLSQFVQLRRLDLSDMKPSDESPEGLCNLRLLTLAVAQSKKHAKKHGTTPLSQCLTWLNLSNNEALGTSDDALEGIDALAALHVLNASHCALRVLPAGLGALEQLKALVLSHNALVQLPSVFPHFPELNTLVLSNNQLTCLPKTLPASLPALKKLSISHNLLQDGDTLPDFSVCAQLREVRLCGNKTLRRLPEHIQRWGRGVNAGAPGLALLDVSDCGLDDWISLAPLLEQPQAPRRGSLANLCLRGNGVALRGDYRERPAQTYGFLTKCVYNQNRSTRRLASSRAHAPEAPHAEAHAAHASKPHAATSEARPLKRAHAELDARGKKLRKRSGRGPKKSQAAAPDHGSRGDSPAAAEARRHARAGPAPEALVEEPSVSSGGVDDAAMRRRARAGPPPDDSEAAGSGDSDAEHHAHRLARTGPPPAPEAAPSGARGKKTRRKKKGAHAVELAMDAGPAERAVWEAPGEAARAVQPVPEAPAAPSKDTGVVDVVQVRAAPRTVPLDLGRREADLGSW